MPGGTRQSNLTQGHLPWWGPDDSKRPLGVPAIRWPHQAIYNGRELPSQLPYKGHHGLGGLGHSPERHPQGPPTNLWGWLANPTTNWQLGVKLADNIIKDIIHRKIDEEIYPLLTSRCPLVNEIPSFWFGGLEQNKTHIFWAILKQAWCTCRENYRPVQKGYQVMSCSGNSCSLHR